MAPRCRVRTFFGTSEKIVLHGLLSPAEATWPIDPTSSGWASSRGNFRDRNWLPWSEWTTQPAASPPHPWPLVVWTGKSVRDPRAHWELAPRER